jgi:AmmeMemoRadiSam system protein B
MARYLRRLEMYKIFLTSVILTIITFPLYPEGFIPDILAKDITNPNNVSNETRPPSVAGPFYPASASQLKKTVNEMMNRVSEEKPEGSILAATAPHAAYVYSGEVAAHTFKHLSNVDFDTIVIIGHDSYRNAVAYTCPVDYFQTPLGKVPVDLEMIEKMHAYNRGIQASRLIHSRDHTIEVHLPFLQVMGKDCKIVPILFGNPTPENCRILADAIISSAGDKKVFVLASTDMSHYLSYESANKIDAATLEVLQTMDINRLLAPDLQTALCSRGAVGTAILFARAKGANHVQVLHYANSGDVPIGSKREVVGYSSALFLKTDGGK